MLCGGQLQDGRATASGGIAFECARHGAYIIARTALPRFLAASKQEQAAALERAKAFIAQRNGQVMVTSFEL